MKSFPFILSLCSISCLPALADVVVVESKRDANTIEFDPPYAEIAGGWFSSSAKSSAPGTSPSSYGSRFANANGTEGEPAAFRVTPTLANAGGRYTVDITHPTSSSIPTDLEVQITVVGGTGLPSTTTVFSQSNPNTWEFVGTLQLDPGVTAPQLIFTILGDPPSFSRRFYADSVRFSSADDPCLSGLPEIVTVNGPLAAGQTFVIVPNVDASATAVTVYANDVAIGTRTSGITAGTNLVTTSGLVKGQIITATQTDAQQVESCRPTTGPLVGGGANPALRIALSIRQNTNLVGPIGTNGGVTGPLKFLGSGFVVGGFGTAPSEGAVLQPDRCWRTVSFLRGDDPAQSFDFTYLWAGSDPDFGSELHGDFGILESLAIAIQDVDTGPYRIYVDNIMNGQTLIQDFEGPAAGTAGVLFNQPGFSGTTSPFLLAQPPGVFSPNTSVVTDEQANTGTQSALIEWQFRDAGNVNWVRLATQGSDTPNPVVDLRLPISFRILLLPVGETTAALSVPNPPSDQAVCPGDDATFAVTAAGEGTFSYQWRKDGISIPSATADEYTVSNVQAEDLGAYSVEVSNGTCSVVTPPAALTIATAPGDISIRRDGEDVLLVWQGSCFALQSAPAVTGSYTDVPGASSPHRVTVAPGTMEFFRLRGAQ